MGCNKKALSICCDSTNEEHLLGVVILRTCKYYMGSTLGGPHFCKLYTYLGAAQGACATPHGANPQFGGAGVEQRSFSKGLLAV